MCPTDKRAVSGSCYNPTFTATRKSTWLPMLLGWQCDTGTASNAQLHTNVVCCDPIVDL
jgi:hypothetical protein